MAKNKVKRRRKKKHPKFWLGFKIFILLFLLAILIGGTVFYFKYGRDIFQLQDEAVDMVRNSTEDTFRASETSIIYNSKGKQISVLKGDKDSYYMPVEEIPQYVKDAFLVTEDRKYYEHNGIDPGANVRAVLALIRHKGEITQGASTITQQLARGVFLTQEVTYERKLKEIFVAMEMEKKYTKDQILEFYLNSIYFSNGYYGIEAAAKGYFSSSCKDLSLSQLCFLASIPNNPTLYDPVKKKENTLKRRDRILEQMLTEGVITQAEHDLAVQEQIELNITEPVKRNFIQTFVTYSATREIMKLNGFEFQYGFDSEKKEQEYEEDYNEAYAAAQKQLINGGYRIYTSIDLKKQKALQNAVNTNLANFKDKGTNGIYQMQGAAVCLDNETGRVVAIVGGRSQKTSGYTLNRAFQSFRQPGSSIKPVIVYTPALERDYTPDTAVNDHRFKGGPSNSNGRYSGYISLRYAVEQSKNTIAWQLFDELTPEVGLQYLLDMQFTKIVKSDYYNASSLGGLTYGCSALEMASAYATIENNGKYREPTCIVKILDADGNTVVEDDVDQKYIYDSKAANSMVDVLKGVITRGTGRGLALENDMISAGKTGTTNDKKDGWFCGFTPYYTTAVWIGCDNPTAISDLSGSSYPGRTWQMFMNEIHAELEPIPFPWEIVEEEEEQKTSGTTSRNRFSISAQKPNDDASDEDEDEQEKEQQEEKSKKNKKPKVTAAPKQSQEQSQEQSQQPAADAGAGGNAGEHVGGTSNQEGAAPDVNNSTTNDDTTYQEDNTNYQEDSAVAPAQ